MKYIPLPSCNCDDRDGHIVDMLVLHYTGMQSPEAALDRLCDPTAKVSAHYVIDEAGKIYQLVPENMRAWHAGVSYWRGHTNINQRSIGIELINPGHEYGYRPFPKEQMISLAELCKEILARHPIPARNVVGHSDIAPERKEDPGELFDWAWLAGQGIGLWPKNVDGGQWMVDGDINPTNHQPPTTNHLAAYGYPTTNLPKTIMAFQRHFRPKLLSGKWDRECALILNTLLDTCH